ncbi:hypothetical protein [Enhygromyxa salina]|nr:hypothetical protein [Enhygromyxa salina]
MAAPSVEPEQLSAFLDRHPWPPHMLAGQRAPLEFLWRFEVDAPLARMWPMLIDTSRFNRALGLTGMDYEERGGQLHVTVVNGGFRQTWVEVPWQWIHGRHMEAVRDYSEGFGRWFGRSTRSSRSTTRALCCLSTLAGSRAGGWARRST